MSMLDSITVWRCVIPLRVSFSHNLATRNTAETLILRVRTRSGLEGYGQALPRAYLTGESFDSALESIRSQWWPRLAALPFDIYATVGDALDGIAPVLAEADACRNNAAFAAVETAVLDAFCRERGIALALPGAKDSMPLVGVISGTGARKAAWLARIYRWLGYRHFKVKVGIDADADARRLEAVRRVIGPDAWLAVDANQAWTFDEGLRRAPHLQGFGVTVVEEPLKAGEAETLVEWEKVAGLPVMADETLCTVSDAHALIQAGGPSWWNLRLGKNGGFAAVREMAGLAAIKHINVYMGVLVGETSGMAAAGRAAMFGAGAAVAEYGFPRVFLKGDPFRGGPGGWSGQARRPRVESGLGVSFREDECLKAGAVAWESATS